MVIALYLLALVMVFAGAAATYQGALIFAFSSGATLVTAGVTAATGGLLLAGVAALLGALRRVEDAVRGRDRGSPSPEPREVGELPGAGPPPTALSAAGSAPALIPAASPAGNGAAPGREERSADLRGTLPAPEPPLQEAALPEPPAERGVAGTYASGGNTYVMFTDGSVQADTPNGRFQFGTVDELKAFLAKGGEKGGERG